MDYGHYNCRDYYISPHFSPTTIVNDKRTSLYRHESFDELEERSRSPASQKPKFPLLSLPLELRQQIFAYLLPHTQEFQDSGLLGEHARNFSAVKKRAAKGMFVPSSNASNNATGAVNNVVWRRGNINLLSVCKQLHQECSEMIYSTNTFLLFITFAGIKFRFRWLLPSGLAPSKSYDFIKEFPGERIVTLLPQRYMRLIRRIVVHVDHVDGYTGMIKFGVQNSKGLTHGLRAQVQRLVDHLQGSQQDSLIDYIDWQNKRLTHVNVRVSNGNAIVDALKSEAVRQQESGIKVAEDVGEMLEPFGDLRGVQQVHIGGAVNADVARSLEHRMTNE